MRVRPSFLHNSPWLHNFRKLLGHMPIVAQVGSDDHLGDVDESGHLLRGSDSPHRQSINKSAGQRKRKRYVIRRDMR